VCRSVRIVCVVVQRLRLPTNNAVGGTGLVRYTTVRRGLRLTESAGESVRGGATIRGKGQTVRRRLFTCSRPLDQSQRRLSHVIRSAPRDLHLLNSRHATRVHSRSSTHLLCKSAQSLQQHTTLLFYGVQFAIIASRRR